MKTLDLDFIKKQREKLGFSHQSMAEKMGMKNASTYYKYETGAYAFKAEHLPLLAKQLRCKITDFFTQNVAESATEQEVS